MSQIAEAFVRMRPDFAGFKTTAIQGATDELRGLKDAVIETENTIKKAARENITSAVMEKEELSKLHTEYALIAKNAVKGSEVQIEANKLAGESARKLGIVYKETAASTGFFGKSVAASTTEASRLERGALAGSGAMSGMGRSVAFASASFLGAAGLVGGIKASIGEASELQAQMNRTNEVFKRSAGEILSWSKTTVTSMGLARTQALDAAGTMGTLLQNIGQTAPAAAKTSMTLVQLAADMAAFKKVSPDVALNALEAALQGRTRSLKQFGIVIDSTSLKAEALSEGLLKGNVDLGKVADAQTKVAIATEKLNQAVTKHGQNSVQAASATIALHNAQGALEKSTSGVTGVLTSQQKALATVGLVMKQTKEQQGTFAKSQGELVVQQMKFHAALKNLEAEIGTALLPVVTHYASVFADWMAQTANSKTLIDDVRKAADIFRQVVSDLVGVVKIGWAAFHDLTSALGGTKNAVIALFAVLAVNKMRSIVGEVIQLGLKFGLIGTASKTAAGVAERSMFGMKVATVGLGATIKGALVTTGIGAVIIGVSLLAEYVLTHWSKVKGYTTDLAHALVSTFKGMWQIIEGMAESAAGTLTTFLTAPIRALLEGLSHLPFVGGKFKAALDGLKSFTTNWVTDGVAKMKAGGEEMGGAWGKAFAGKVDDSLKAEQQKVNLFSFGGAIPNLGGAGPSGSGSLQARVIGTAVGVGSAHIPYQTGGGRSIGGASALSKPTDCSGMVHNILAANGVSIPLTSQSQWRGGTAVTGPLEPGDLLFYNNHLNEAAGQPGHVTMYIGGSQMVEDPHTGGTTQIVPVRNDGYMGARRYIKTKTETPNTSPPGTGSAAAAARSTTGSAMKDLTSGAVAKAPKGLLSQTGAINLKEALSALGDETLGIAPASLRKQIQMQIKLLTDAIHKGLGPEVVAGLRKDVGDVRKEVSTGLSLDKTVTTIRGNIDAIKKTIGGLPAPLRAQLAPQMKALMKELNTVSTPEQLTQAKADYKKLTTAIKDEQSRMRDLLRQHTREQLAAWKAHLNQLKQAVSDAKRPFETAFQNLVDTALTVFDRATSRHLATLQANLDAAIAGIDAGLQSKLASIEAQRAALTPAEQELRDIQAAHQAAADAAQLAKDQAQLVTDKAGGADAATLAADQAQINDDLYNQKVQALQNQATLERTAADKQAADRQKQAQDDHDAQAKAAQANYDAEAQNYQDLRDLQKKSFENQLADLKVQLETRGTTVDGANQDILALMGKFGLDPAWFQSGNDAGSELLKGLEAAFAAAAPTLSSYQQAADAAAAAAAAKPQAPITPKDKTQAILDELKKQTKIAQENASKTPTVTVTTGNHAPGDNINQVTRDALR